MATSNSPAPQMIPTERDQNRNTRSMGSLMAVRKRTMERAPTIPREISRRPVMPAGQHILEVKYDEFLPDYIYRNLQIQRAPTIPREITRLDCMARIMAAVITDRAARETLNPLE